MVTGDTAWGILQHAKAHGALAQSKEMIMMGLSRGYAIPAFNCTSTSCLGS